MNLKGCIENIKIHMPYILALIVLTIFFMLYFFNPNLPAHDIATSYFPFAQTLKISMLEYKDFWPLWTPYGFSGSLFLAKPIDSLGIDSILGIMLLIIPSTVIALKLTYVISFFIAGISMYSLMVYLKIDKKFAFISAIVYILNAYVAKLLTWGWLSTLGGYAIMPLVFLFGTKAIREKEWVKYSIITAIVYAILFRLNPDMKVGIWLGLLFGAYLLFNIIINFSINKLIRISLITLLIVIIFFGLSAHRILINIDSLKLTSRADTSWEISSGRPLLYKNIFNRLIEPIYKGMPKIQRKGAGDHIGIIAFLLVLFAIYKKSKDKRVIFFSLGALLSIFITTNTFSIYYLLWRFVPFFKSLRYMDRSLFLFVFCTSILAGIGANELFQRIKKCQKSPVLKYGACFEHAQKPPVYHGLKPTVCTWRFLTYQKQLYLSLIALIVINLWLFNYSHYTEGTPKKWINANEAIKNNYILNYISKQPGWFRINTFETRGIDWGTDFYNVPLKLEHIYRYDTMWDPPYMNSYLSIAFNEPAKFWGILNLKYLTSRNELNLSGFKFIKKFENCTVCFPEYDEFAKAWGPYLYENEYFLPRAYILNDSILVVGEENAAMQTVYALMLNKNFNPLALAIIKGKGSINEYSLNELKRFKAIFLTKDSIDQNSNFILNSYVENGGIILPDVTKGKNTVSEDEVNALLKSFSNKLIPIDDKDVIMHNFDKREIKLGKNYKGFLVYSEKFSVFPGWQVTSGKTKKEIYNADATITSVYLEGNEESLIFEYKPKAYITGLIITIITLFLLITYFSYFIYKRSKKNPN